MKLRRFLPNLKNLWFLFILLSPCFLSASTYYVDNNLSSANDNNPGTLNSPWRTIQHATETLVAGDTVYVRDGIYNENLYFDNSGDAVNGHIVFSAYQGEKPVIDGTGVTDADNGIVLDKSYIMFVGFEIRNWNENGVWIENASFVEITDCEVHDVFYGIGVADGTHDFEFNRVNVHHFDLYGFDVSPSGGADCYNGIFNDCVSHTGRDPQQNVDGFALGHGTQHTFEFNRCITYNVYDGFDISSQNTKLNRCLAYNCWNGCYKLWQDKILLVNCIGYNSAVSIVELDWDGDPGASTLMNCTFFNSESFTIWVEHANDTLKMYNCILAGGDNIGLAFEQRDASNYTGDYNLFHNDNDNRTITVGYEDEFSSNQIESGAWTTYSGQDAHSLVANSDTDIFVDSTDPDLHLSNISTAIDHGTSDSAPFEDFDGNPRPEGARVDIGAFEFQTPASIRDEELLKINPLGFKLYQNYPNPFNPTTIIIYELKQKGYVELKIKDILGREVRALVAEEHSQGIHKVIWNGLDDQDYQVASDVYFYTLSVNGEKTTKKLLLVR